MIKEQQNLIVNDMIHLRELPKYFAGIEHNDYLFLEDKNREELRELLKKGLTYGT